MNENDLFSSDGQLDVLLTATESGERLDLFAAREGGISRSLAQKLIENGSIKVNGKTVAKNYNLRLGDDVQIAFPEPELCEAVAEDIPLDIVYEDRDIIVINKPVGMVVHPSPGHSGGTLVNALMYHAGNDLSGIGGVSRPGIVHRIDRDTSGLICVAKNDAAHIALSAQLSDHTMHREYRMIVTGNLREEYGTVDAPIARHPNDRKKMAVVRGGRTAITHWEVIERFSGFTYASARLETGRTHQIRVHMSYIGHALMGDTVYGGGHTTFEKHSAPLIFGQMLHAESLVLIHPSSGERMRFDAPLPENFTAILEKLRNISR